MSGSSRGDGINSSGAQSFITNDPDKVISVRSSGSFNFSTGGDGIEVSGSQSTITNSVGASISVGTVSGAGYAVNIQTIGSNSGAQSVINNFGTINGGRLSSGAINLNAESVSLNNQVSGIITNSTALGNAINVRGTGSSVDNAGQISSTLGSLGAINVNASSVSLRNQASGIISHAGIASSAITVNSSDASINNQGSIAVTGITAHGIRNNSSGLSIVNTGSILTQDSIPFIRNINQDIFGAFAIRNTGSIASLVNAQGGDASQDNRIALTYNGTLPSRYEVIVTDPTRYGQLFVRNASGSMAYAINDQTDLRKGTYSGVLVGVGSNNLANTNGGYKGFTFQLVNNGDPVVNSLIWDLIVTGAYTVDTQQSLVNTASVLQGTFTLQNTVMINGFTYDCPLFDTHGVCISAGGRNTTVQVQGINNTSGLLIASYRLDQNNSRIGAWIDQNLTVSGPGNIKLGNSMPMIGFFGVWSERPDGVGAEIKASIAYGQKDVTVTRSVVGTSEPGSGGSQLVTQGAQAVGKYGFAVLPDTVVSPYAGVRYTQNNMGGYTEAATSAVTAPLTYSALNTNATTLLAGAEARYRGIPKTTLFASAGVESDVRNDNDSYSATGISGLTPINFNPNPVKTRPTATAGAYYDIMKNQRIGVTGIYRQEPYQAVSTTTVLATYTIGL